MKSSMIIALFLITGILVSACKKKNEEDPKPFAAFTVNGVAHQFNVASSFGKLCLFSHYCGDFMANGSQIDKNIIGFGFPADIAAGQTYESGQHHVHFFYINAAGNHYYSSSGGHMTVTITVWGGNGGWVKGTFSGTMAREDDPLNDSVMIQNGAFEGKIFFIE